MLVGSSGEPQNGAISFWNLIDSLRKGKMKTRSSTHGTEGSGSPIASRQSSDSIGLSSGSNSSGSASGLTTANNSGTHTLGHGTPRRTAVEYQRPNPPRAEARRTGDNHSRRRSPSPPEDRSIGTWESIGYFLTTIVGMQRGNTVVMSPSRAYNNTNNHSDEHARHDEAHSPRPHSPRGPHDADPPINVAARRKRIEHVSHALRPFVYIRESTETPLSSTMSPTASISEERISIVVQNAANVWREYWQNQQMLVSSHGQTAESKKESDHAHSGREAKKHKASASGYGSSWMSEPQSSSAHKLDNCTTSMPGAENGAPNPIMRRSSALRVGVGSGNAGVVWMLQSPTGDPLQSPDSEPLSTVEEDIDCIEIPTNCSICMNHFDNNETIAETECRHVFHFNCISHWLIMDAHNDCPLCRTKLIDLMAPPIQR